MPIEHVAFNIADPVAAAAWYTAHLGFRVLRYSGPPNHGYFLADAGGAVFEFYNNPAVTVPDYASIHPLVVHIAFAVDDVPRAFSRLCAAGATPFDEPAANPDGDMLALLRDPWGLPLQLVQRRTPLLG